MSDTTPTTNETTVASLMAQLATLLELYRLLVGIDAFTEIEQQLLDEDEHESYSTLVTLLKNAELIDQHHAGVVKVVPDAPSVFAEVCGLLRESEHFTSYETHSGYVALIYHYDQYLVHKESAGTPDAALLATLNYLRNREAGDETQ